MSKVTTTDVARAAGVSQTTVSVVLSGRDTVSISDATRQKVLAAADALGYVRRGPRVARLKRRHSGLIGLLVPNLNNIFFTNIVLFVERYASQAGYELVVCNIERKTEREDQKLASLIEKGVDGIIVAYTPRDIANLKRIGQRLPVVILGEGPDQSGIQTIGINGTRCGELMAKHLFELGHRDIVMFTSPVSRISLTRPRRIAGARAFLSSVGCADRFSVLEDDTEEEFDEIYEFESGYKLARRLIESRRAFTALMVSDMHAPGVYAQLAEMGLKVPHDVSVVGIDNTFVSRILTPQLTTVDHHLRERCKLAVEHMTELIAKAPPFGEGYLVEYSPTLVVRQSTAPQRRA